MRHNRWLRLLIALLIAWPFSASAQLITGGATGGGGSGTVTSSGPPVAHQLAIFSTATNIIGLGVCATGTLVAGATGADPTCASSPTVSGTFTAGALATNGAGTGCWSPSGVTSGTAQVCAQDVAGTPALVLGTNSGTLVASATAPLAVSATTGNLSLPTTMKSRAIPFTVSVPGGTALTVASTTTDYVTVPFACTISAWNLLVDAGTITVKIWKIATGTAIPTVSNIITPNGLPITTATASRSTTNASEWSSTAVSANDMLAMNVTAVATAAFVNGVLQCDQ